MALDEHAELLRFAAPAPPLFEDGLHLPASNPSASETQERRRRTIGTLGYSRRRRRVAADLARPSESRFALSRSRSGESSRFVSSEASEDGVAP